MSSIYRKGEVLGWGSIAAVYTGWDELLDRPVGIKELKQPFSGNEAFSRAFRTQALKLLDVSHRHVLATYAVDSDRNVHAVVREVAEETVGQQSFQGPMELEKVLKILRSALLGLDILHGRDFVHRAVKPENVFLCGDTYKLGDFGLPPVEGAPSMPARRFRYAAPEEIASPEIAFKESDLYSLGAMTYELILGPIRFEQVMEELLRESGYRPASGSSGESRDRLWPRFHVSPMEFPPLLDLEPGVPAALSLALQKMVAKDRTARFGTCRQVLSSLGSATTEFPTGRQNITVVLDGVRSQTGKEKSRAWIVGGASAASAVLAASIWGLVTYRQAQPSPKPPPKSGNYPQESVASQRPDPEIRLINLLGHESNATLSLDPPQSSLKAGTPLHFRITASKAGYMVLFAVSSDGSVTPLYPNQNMPELKVDGGQSLVLPLEEEIDIKASPPLGRELVFMLHSPAQLPKAPDDSALELVDWVEAQLQEHPEASLTAVEFEVVAAP